MDTEGIIAGEPIVGPSKDIRRLSLGDTRRMIEDRPEVLPSACHRETESRVTVPSN